MSDDLRAELNALKGELTALRAEVRRLGDVEAIRKLTSEYMQAMHDARWDDAVACFADEASYDHGILGNLATKADIVHFYTVFMRQFEEGGGYAFDMLTNATIDVKGDKAEARWFLLTMLTDPDHGEAAWGVATLEYEYIRQRGEWKFHICRCISEHQLVDYRIGWGKSGQSRVSSFTEAESPFHFEIIKAQGGKQKPGKLSHSIRGWTVPTLPPETKARRF